MSIQAEEGRAGSHTELSISSALGGEKGETDT